MIELVKAYKKDKVLFRNLFNLYQYDISIYSDEFDYINEEGYFDKTSSDVFFNNPQIYPYLIIQNNKIMGFVVVSSPPFVKSGFDYCIQEMFILKKHQGRKIAEQAVDEVFKVHPGSYALVAFKDNFKAVHFWTKITCKNKSGKIENLDDKMLCFTFNI